MESGRSPGRKTARAIGVCSWSLRAQSPSETFARAAECGVSALQLALRPLREGGWRVRDVLDLAARGGIALCSGMMAPHGEDYSTIESIARTGGLRPDRHWERNRAIAAADARRARELGLPLVTFHAGFLPHERADPERAKLVARLREVVDLFAAEGVRVALETGQESAETLLDVLDELDRPACGVNFDPANMILYGTGEPVAALRALATRVAQVHVKDALPPARRGEWGTEVPVGTGGVDWRAFFAVLDAHAPYVDLVVEREAGDQRIADVRRACELVRSLATGVA